MRSSTRRKRPKGIFTANSDEKKPRGMIRLDLGRGQARPGSPIQADDQGLKSVLCCDARERRPRGLCYMHESSGCGGLEWPVLRELPNDWQKGAKCRLEGEYSVQIFRW